MIKFVPVNEDNYRECFKLSVFESQKFFVATNERSLAQAYIYKEKFEPYCIFNEDTMVGFIQFIPDDEDLTCMYLWRFMIDQKYQGKGFGKEAMELFIENIKSRNQYQTIKLSYCPENTHAEKLYSLCGFTKTGVIDEGEVEMVLNLKDNKI